MCVRCIPFAPSPFPFPFYRLHSRGSLPMSDAPPSAGRSSLCYVEPPPFYNGRDLLPPPPFTFTSRTDFFYQSLLSTSSITSLAGPVLGPPRPEEGQVLFLLLGHEPGLCLHFHPPSYGDLETGSVLFCPPPWSALYFSSGRGVGPADAGFFLLVRRSRLLFMPVILL